MSQQTNNSFSGNLGSSNSPAFTLLGGRYDVLASASNWNSGSLDLQALGPDGQTYVSCLGSSKLTANGSATVQVPAGQYILAVTSASGVYASIAPIGQGSVA